MNKKEIKYYLEQVLREVILLFQSVAFKLLLILLLVISIFYNYLKPLYTSLIIDPLLSNVESINRNSLVVLALSVFLLGSSIYRIIKRKRISTIYVIYVFVICATYIYFRNKGNYCYSKFTLKYIEDYNYLDFILLFGSITTVEYIYGLIVKYSGPAYSHQPFEIDLPISTSDNDLFGRKQFAEEISKKVTSKYNVKTSLAIGIDGIWGSGKTSFIKMIKEYIHKSPGDDNRLIIDFHPWKSSTPQQIISDFFEVFTNEIKQYSPNLSRNINSYAKSLTKLDENALTKSMDALFDLFDKDKTKEDQYNLINDALEGLNKQVIVIIDDIDRLDKKEITEVIRLIRNTASFHNTIFIVTYEREYLLNAIKELNEHNYKHYLDKIFQFEFTLPSFELGILKNVIQEKITPFLNEDHKAPFNSILYPTGIIGSPPDLFSKNIKTYRDVVRFVNSFLFDYSFIKDEIDVEDFSILQLLKLKFPDVFDVLFEKRNRFLDTVSSTYFQNGLEYVLRTEKREDANKEKHPILYYYLKNECHTVKYKDCEIWDVIEVVDSLFKYDIDSIRSFKRNQKSISIIDNFYKYFANRVFAGEISISEFQNAFNSPYEEFLKKLDYWIGKDFLNDISIRLSRINISDLKTKEDFEKLIKSIFYFSSKTAIAGSKYLFDTGKLYNLLYQEKTSRLIQTWYGDIYEDYLSFVNGLFADAQSPYAFESFFIRIIYDRHVGHFVLPEEDLINFQLTYLKSYTEKSKSFDSALWSLIYNNKLIEKFNEQGSSYQVRPKHNLKVTEIIVEFIEKNKLLDELLKSLVHWETFDQNLLGLSTQPINAIFGGLNMFEVFLEGQKNNSSSEYISEYIKFYEETKKVGYQYIKPNFVKMPLPEKR